MTRRDGSVSEFPNAAGGAPISEFPLEVGTGSGGGGSYTDEQVRDVMGATLVAGANTTITVDDPGDTITITSSAGSGTAAFRHVQAGAATTWTITHGLLFRPNVTVVDSAGTEIFPGTLVYTSATVVTLTFSAAVGGEAYCS